MPKLAVLATVFEVARTRPARPLREFFQPPEAPIREMYLYRFMVNLMWYARNYTNMALVWSSIVCMLAPLFIFNFIAAVALHFWKLSLTASSGHSVSDCDMKGRRGITPSVQNLFGASRVLVGIRESSHQLLTGLKGSDASRMRATTNKTNHVREIKRQSFSMSPSPDDETDAKTKKPTPTVRSVTIVLKLMQLICCGVVIDAYGIWLTAFYVMVPIFFVSLHALMTPYSDTASEYFEKSGAEVEAPSTPVLAYLVRAETSFGVARGKMAKAAMEKAVEPESPTIINNWLET